MGKLLAVVSLGLFLTFNSDGHAGSMGVMHSVASVVVGINGGAAPVKPERQNVFDNQAVRECRDEATMNLGQMIKSIFNAPCAAGTDKLSVAHQPMTTRIGG